MSEATQVKSDLDYVRQVVESSEQNQSPAAIYLFWAAVVLVGFPLVDFAPERVGWYWLIAAPLGFVVSTVLGVRYNRRLGQMSRAIGRRYGLHWLALLAAIFLAVPLGITGAIAWPELAKVFVLLVALTYFLAGVHLDRPLLWVGLLIGAGYLALFLIPSYAWTVLGVVVAAALAAAAWMVRTPRDATTG